MKHVAALSLSPLILIFFLWARRTYILTRGPAGILGAVIILLPALLCLGIVVWIYRNPKAPLGRLVAGVAVIYGLLIFGLMVLLPGMRQAHVSAQEAATLDGLSEIRSGIEAYTRDRKAPPERPSHLVGAYISALPALALPSTGHPITREVEFADDAVPVDSGKWLYVNNPKNPFYGKIRINCTHTDSRNARWSKY